MGRVIRRSQEEIVEPVSIPEKVEEKVVEKTAACTRFVILESDNNSTKAVSQGDEIKLILIEDPSNALKWLINSSPSFLNLIDEAKKTFNSSDEYRQFTYVVQTTGSGAINLIYKNGWDDKSPVLKTVTFNIVAK